MGELICVSSEAWLRSHRIPTKEEQHEDLWDELRHEEGLIPLEQAWEDWEADES